jgi:hypothetical protein
MHPPAAITLVPEANGLKKAANRMRVEGRQAPALGLRHNFLSSPVPIRKVLIRRQNPSCRPEFFFRDGSSIVLGIIQVGESQEPVPCPFWVRPCT